jgi:pimeloyl-ACP methyl ester carboxylesterase
MTIEHGTADVDGITLHYAHSGKDNDHLLLFLHGFPEFWYEWRHQLEEFGRDYHAVAPDGRGYNLSSKPVGVDNYQSPNMVEDVRQLALHFGAKKFTLVGHDWGGAVAWAFAIAHPEMLDKLVMINMAHIACFLREMENSVEQQAASQYVRLMKSDEAEAVLSANNFEELWKFATFDELQARGLMTDEDKAAYKEAWGQPGALTGMVNWYRAAFFDVKDPGQKPDPSPIAGMDLTVRVPTLLIWGDRDKYLTNGCLDGTEEFVPNVTIKKIPGVSHWVATEKPDLVNQYMPEFLET